MPAPAPRTLAEQLRGWSDEALSALLAARPDLTAPAPRDSVQLASRAGSRGSVMRALDQLTYLELVVLDALAALGGAATGDRLRGAVRAAPEAVDAALARLRRLALVWGSEGRDEDDVRAVSAVADAVGTSLSGLGQPVAQLLAAYGPARVAGLAADLGLAPTGDRAADVASVTSLLADPQTVRGIVSDLDERARAILDHLERTGSLGEADGADREVRVADAQTPVEQLLARGLLVASGRRHAAVPREVALSLRGGRTTREPVDGPPALVTGERDAQLVDRAAAGAATELVRHVELLLEHWGAHPPSALRTGGLAVRDLKAAATLLHLPERTAALHAEVALAAGLVAVGSADAQESAWLPTDDFDAFLAAPAEQQWARLGLAWLTNHRLTGLVGSREAGRTVNALAPELDRAWLAQARQEALHELAGVPEGTVLPPGTGLASLLARLRWLRPRRPPARADAVSWALEEAAVLGVVGLGGLSVHGRALLRFDPAIAAAALRPLLPPFVDHVLVQADLTAVAPGPLVPALAHRLAAMADVESRGGATVYRFTESSVRRAFDAGWSAAEIHELVTSVSSTDVPQPLRYLVDDVARTYGTVRVGAAESFLRSDDETALAALVHDPMASSLRLRRIAPTVVVSDVPVDLLVPRLRDLGVAPVVEAADGTIRLASPQAHRARTPRPHPDPVAAARSTARVAATVTAIRSGDHAARHRPAGAAPPARLTPTSTVAALREALEARDTVWIGYVDNDGSVLERVVDPLRVDGGRLRAFDHRSEEERSFAVHRITAVRTLPADPA